MAIYNFRHSPLPAPTMQYDLSQQIALIRSIERYFTQLDSTAPLLAEYFIGRGDQLTIPTALYFSTVDQGLAAINTAYPIAFENTYYQNELSINGASNSQVTAQRKGIYNFQFSGQLLSQSSNAKTAQIWLRKNGTDVGYSAHQYTDSSNGAYIEINWNFNIDLDVGDYIELIWAADDTDLVLKATTSSAPYPGTSSAVLAVNFISAIRDFTVAEPPSV